ncbi:helix-turn-helix domain-containing protein [Lactobacillus delbrueckii subsp. bulgaricus]
MSTPAVVQQMNLLEKRLNVQLFVRNYPWCNTYSSSRN